MTGSVGGVQLMAGGQQQGMVAASSAGSGQTQQVLQKPSHHTGVPLQSFVTNQTAQQNNLLQGHAVLASHGSNIVHTQNALIQNPNVVNVNVAHVLPNQLNLQGTLIQSTTGVCSSGVTQQQQQQSNFSLVNLGGPQGQQILIQRSATAHGVQATPNAPVGQTNLILRTVAPNQQLLQQQQQMHATASTGQTVNMATAQIANQILTLQLTPPQQEKLELHLSRMTLEQRRPFSAPSSLSWPNFSYAQRLYPHSRVRIHQQLSKDQANALAPDTKNPFKDYREACRRLLRYHTFQSPADRDFESMSEDLVEQKDAMLAKYRLLLMEESMRGYPTAEMVYILHAFVPMPAQYLEQKIPRDDDSSDESAAEEEERVEEEEPDDGDDDVDDEEGDKDVRAESVEEGGEEDNNEDDHDDDELAVSLIAIIIA
nr:hypothetical protein BaRGS_011352 [Batillaria attramentaria]